MICPHCHNGRLYTHNNELVCHNPNCSYICPLIDYHIHPGERCNTCFVGSPILDGGEFICNNCGTLIPLEESITDTESDIPQKYTKIPADRHEHTQEVAIGNKTRTIKVKTEKEENRERRQRQRQQKKTILNRATKSRNDQQIIMVKSAICDITKALDLKPAKVLARFQSRLKKNNDILINRGRLRAVNCVAAAFVYKVHKNRTTTRQLRKISKCGGKSFQKILRLI